MQLPQATVYCTFPKVGSPYLCNAAVNYLLQSCINGTKIIFCRKVLSCSGSRAMKTRMLPLASAPALV